VGILGCLAHQEINSFITTLLLYKILIKTSDIGIKEKKRYYEDFNKNLLKHI